MRHMQARRQRNVSRRADTEQTATMPIKGMRTACALRICKGGSQLCCSQYSEPAPLLQLLAYKNSHSPK
jgi:hypothetical protein